MTQALNPKVAEIKEKYADNKDLQNQMVALLYQETKVILWTTCGERNPNLHNIKII